MFIATSSWKQTRASPRRHQIKKPSEEEQSTKQVFFLIKAIYSISLNDLNNSYHVWTRGDRCLLAGFVLSPDQTIATCQRNIPQHCWAQHVCVWPPCCDVFRHVGVVVSSLEMVKFEPTTQGSQCFDRLAGPLHTRYTTQCLSLLLIRAPPWFCLASRLVSPAKTEDDEGVGGWQDVGADIFPCSWEIVKHLADNRDFSSNPRQHYSLQSKFKNHPIESCPFCTLLRPKF